MEGVRKREGNGGSPEESTGERRRVLSSTRAIVHREQTKFSEAVERDLQRCASYGDT